MFNLADYEREIREGATKAGVTPVTALEQFIYNLAIMRPHYDIFGNTINFRTLGQKWNTLSSDIRNMQKREMVSILSKSTRARNITHE